MITGTALKLAAIAVVEALAVLIVYDAARSLRSRKLRAATVAVAVAVSLAFIAVRALVDLERARARAQAEAEIQATLEEIRGAVAENDFERALAFVSENATQTRSLVRRNRDAVKIKDASVSDLKILELDLNGTPPRATVSFKTSVRGTATAWPTPIRLPYRIELELDGVEFQREKDGVWRLQDRYSVKSTAL